MKFNVLTDTMYEGIYEHENLSVEGVLEILDELHKDKYTRLVRIAPVDNPSYTEKEFRKKYCV